MARLLLSNGQRISVKEDLAQIEHRKMVEENQLTLHLTDGSKIKLGRKMILDIRDEIK